jgi:hypothetical protein
MQELVMNNDRPLSSHEVNPQDYFAIHDLINRYNLAVDTNNFELLWDIFTPDGIIDYQEFGGHDVILQKLLNGFPLHLAPFLLYSILPATCLLRYRVIKQQHVRIFITQWE